MAQKNKARLRSFIAALIVSLPVAAHAQLSVWLQAETPDDPIGTAMVGAIKESIVQGTNLKWVDRPKEAQLYLRLRTKNADKNGVNPKKTVYSLTWTAQTLHTHSVEMYLASMVGTCAPERVTSCAQQVVDATEEQAKKIRVWYIGGNSGVEGREGKKN